MEKVSKANSVDENFDDYLSCEDDEFMTKTMKVIFDFSIKISHPFIDYKKKIFVIISFYLHINIKKKFD